MLRYAQSRSISLVVTCKWLRVRLVALLVYNKVRDHTKSIHYTLSTTDLQKAGQKIYALFGANHASLLDSFIQATKSSIVEGHAAKNWRQNMSVKVFVKRGADYLRYRDFQTSHRWSERNLGTVEHYNT